MSKSYYAPAEGDRPRSRGWRFIRGLFRLLEQAWRWDEWPNPASFREAVEQRDKAQGEVRAMGVELAAARAEADAMEAELKILSAVVTRNRERVMKETAEAVADREKALANTAASKTARRVE